MNLWYRATYLYKIVLRRIKKFFYLAPSFPFKALISVNKHFNTNVQPPKILYLGDSVVERVADQDDDQRNLGNMLVDELSPLSSLVISFSAYHMLVYYELISTFEVTQKRPQLVILPVNIRSYSPQWDLQPRWQYQEEIAALREYRKSLARKIVELHDERHSVPKFLENKFHNTPVHYPLSDFKTVGQFVNAIAENPISENEKIFRKRQIFIFNYAHPLSSEHRKVVKLKETIELLLKLNIKVFVYVTPINIEACDKYVGVPLRKQVVDNVKVIEEALSSYKSPNNVHFEDWSVSFSSSLFFYDDLATEHLNQNGRLKLAKLISGGVKALLSSDNK